MGSRERYLCLHESLYPVPSSPIQSYAVSFLGPTAHPLDHIWPVTSFFPSRLGLCAMLPSGLKSQKEGAGVFLHLDRICCLSVRSHRPQYLQPPKPLGIELCRSRSQLRVSLTAV